MSQHIRNQHRILVAAPADTAFMFFTPAGEELWVEGWRPTYVHPADGRTCPGMVFLTGQGDDLTIWQVADFDRPARHARYVRTTPALRAGFVEIQCTALDDASSEVTVTYEMTALNAAGSGSLAAYEGAAYVEMIDGWRAAIEKKLPVLTRAQFR